MRSLGTVALFLSLAACSSGGGLPCNEQLPCPDGFSCSREGQCVTADRFLIVTEQLDVAALGQPYSFTLQVSGGLPPYHDWSVDSEAHWLSIDSSGTLQGTPDEGTLGVAVTVSVFDSSWGDGVKTSRSYQLAVLDCEYEGQQLPCFQPNGQLCDSGLHVCSGGKWSPCTSTGPSQDFSHCGAGCSQCPEQFSDRCLGECRCGDRAQCAEPAQCCEGACLDTSSSIRHCGRCGQACDSEQVLNATGMFCQEGKCNYQACKDGFLDCDQARENGCETAMDAVNCGACGQDCAQILTGVKDPQCIAAGLGIFVCDYSECQPEYLDCDSQRTNGCETWLGDFKNCGSCKNNCPAAGTNKACIKFPEGFFGCGCSSGDDCAIGEQCCAGQCVSVDDVYNCGACGNDCSQSSAGPWCVDPAQKKCGCFDRYDCSEKQLCCSQVCIDIDDQHCGACQIACNAVYGGPHCDLYSEQCYCTSNSECANFGAGICEGEGTAARCK